MSMFSFIAGRRLASLALAGVATLAAATASAEFVRVTAANTSGNAIYDVTSFTPAPGTISPLNTDGASHGQFSAVVQVPNVPAGTVDVLAADLTRGQIIRYRPHVGATAAAVITVWTYSGPGSGPAHPDGLSVDAAGNLYIVSSKLNDNSTNQVWVLKANAAAATGYDPAPLLIDSTFGSANGVKYLAETAVATTAGPAWGAGDLLVLVGNGSSSNSQQNSNDADVLVYRAATLATVLGGGGARTSPDAILLNPTQFPPGEYPVGLDFWPAEVANPNPTLLLATSAGRVLRYDFAASACAPAAAPCYTVFASGLGSGLQKIKVGLQLEVPYAFLTQILAGNPGRILQLGEPASPNTTNLLGVATQGVNNPDGLAVARASAVQASTCVITSTDYPLNLPCDLSRGALPHGILAGAQTQAISGNVIESSCVVLSDPRVHGGVCDGTTLDVSTLCPGFGHEVLPGTMCGASGVTGSGFALLRAIASGVDNVPGIVIYNLQDVANILPGASNPVCPNATVAWAPRQEAGSGEGTIVETEPSGYPDLVEMAGFCDLTGGNTRGMSVYAVGLGLNLQAIGGGLAGFVDTKYANLNTTIDRANIVDTTANPVKSTLKASLGQVGVYIAQAKLHAPGSDAWKSNYSCAAAQILNVDALVRGDASPATDYPGDGPNPNPWGEVRGRLANLYYTINARLLGAAPNKTWPLDLAHGDQPAVCPSPVVNIAATPALIQPGGSSTVNWSVDNAASCMAQDGNPGDGWVATPNTKPLDGSQAIANIPGTTTYSLLCSGAGGSNGWGATVTVENAPVIQSFGPAAAAVNDGSGTTLSWVVTDVSDKGAQQSNVSCAVSSSDGSLTVSGLAATASVATGALRAPSTPSTVTYTLTCTNAVGGTTSAHNSTTTVTAVPLPTISTFTTSRSVVTVNADPVTLSWNANVYAAYGGVCTITSVGNTFTRTGLLPAGSVTIASLGVSETYNLACANGLGRTVTWPTPRTVSAVPPPTTSALTAAPAIITAGTASVLSWTAGPGTSCAITTGPTVGSPVTDAGTGITSISTATLTAPGGTVQSYPYALTCSNLAGLVVQPPSITVQAAPLSSLSGAFAAAAANVTTGESTTLSWVAANANSCDVSGGGLAAAPATAPFTITPPTGTNQYVLACTNQAGTRNSFDGSPAIVTAVPPATIASFTASPASVTRGAGAVLLSWTATTNAGKCAITSADNSLTVGNLPASGTQSTGIITTSAPSATYTLTCGNGIVDSQGNADPRGSAVATVTVPVIQRVVAANSVGNSVYDVTFAAGTTSAINGEGASHGSFSSLVFVPNTARGTLDVLVADVTRGQILRYASGTTSASVVWSYSGVGSGPAHPDGLSLDSSGNLYIVTSKLNDSTASAVWVLPANSGSVTGFAATPLLVDGTFAGANGVKTLQETLIATTATAAWSPGDLLVLVGNGSSSKSQPNSNLASVLVYRAATVTRVLGGTAATGPDLMAIGPSQFPGGEYPISLDLWPADATINRPTVLVTTTAGRLLRFDLGAISGPVTPTYAVFASSLGSGLNKVKVGSESGVPYAVVTQALSSSTGRIMKFSAPTAAGSNPPVKTVTQGVASPDGLAVSR